MDLGTLRGLGTLVLLISFVGLIVWAYSPGRRKRFEEAANLPFLGEDSSSTEGKAS